MEDKRLFTTYSNKSRVTGHNEHLNKQPDNKFIKIEHLLKLVTLK